MRFQFLGAVLLVMLLTAVRIGTGAKPAAPHASQLRMSVLFEDGAAVLGILVVFVLLWVGDYTKNPYLDGVASLVVGCLLTFASAVLARESRSLLIGEGISEKTDREIRALVEDVSDGTKVTRVFSLYQAPEEVLLVLIVDFPSGLKTGEISDRIVRIRDNIKSRFAKIAYIVIQPE